MGFDSSFVVLFEVFICLVVPLKILKVLTGVIMMVVEFLSA